MKNSFHLAAPATRFASVVALLLAGAGVSSGGTLSLGTASSGAVNAVGLTNVYASSPSFTFSGGNYASTAGDLSITAVSTPVFSGSLTKNGANTLTLTAASLGHTWSVGAPELSGSAGDLKITTTNGGSTLRVKTSVAVSNTGTKAAKHVTATVYLSDDAILDADDTKLMTLKLEDFLPGVTKLSKGQTFILPIKHKVPTALASFLDGKYLIAVLGSDADLTTNGLSSVQITSGSGVGATAVGTVDADGTLTGVTITNPGVGYTTAPTVTITGSTGGYTITPTTTTAQASVGAITINAGTLQVSNPTGFHFPDLTATAANTFQVNPATGTAATLTVATTGEVENCTPGVTLIAQPGDRLSLGTGTTLTSVAGGGWTTASGGTLTFSPNASLTTLTATAISPGSGSTTVPKNEVIIGPIKLP